MGRGKGVEMRALAGRQQGTVQAPKLQVDVT